MYALLEKLATENLGVDSTKLSTTSETNAPSTIITDFCIAEPYIETGINFAISAIKNPIAKWILQLALSIVKAINTEFCTVKK